MLQRVLYADARVVTGTRKFDRGLGQILYDEFHWLDEPRSGVLQARSDSSTVSERDDRTPLYLSDYCEILAQSDLPTPEACEF